MSLTRESFARFPTTSYPRPTQKPRPKFYIACTNTPDSFEFAGSNGHAIMAIPIGDRIRELIGLYRAAWRKAGHPGKGEVMLAFHMYCEKDSAAARRTAKPFLDHYFKSMCDAASDWVEGMVSSDYAGYDKMFAKLREMDMEGQIASGGGWIGSAAEVREAMLLSRERFGDYEHASLQINFGLLPLEKSLASLRLFAAEVMPYAPR